MLLDAREPADFAAGHLRGAVNVGLQGRFAEWAGDVLSPDRDDRARRRSRRSPSRRRSASAGSATTGSSASSTTRAGCSPPDRELIETSSRLTIEQLAELRGLEPALQLVDVRSPGETPRARCPAPGRSRWPCSTDSLAGLDPATPVVVYCASGYRSQIAASVLRRRRLRRRLRSARRLRRLGGRRAADRRAAAQATASARHPRSAPGPAKALVDAGALLLDVREPDEWQAEHAPEAMLLPMGQVRERQGELPRDRRIVVVCRSGGRSAAVTESLRAWGFDAVNLAGGMCAWAAAGLPVGRRSARRRIPIRA